MDISYNIDNIYTAVYDKTGGGVICEGRNFPMTDIQPGEPDPETGEPGPDTEIIYQIYDASISTNPIAAKVYLSTVAF